MILLVVSGGGPSGQEGSQPHTSEDVGRMLALLGLDDVDELFRPIPAELRAPAGLDLLRPHAELGGRRPLPGRPVRGAYGARLAGAMRRARLVVEDAGHFIQEDRPNEVALLVRNFVAADP